MMGKLSVWRGADSRRDGPEKMRVGGFVSIEDLQSKGKSPSPSKSVRKKAPRLSLGRRSFSLRPQHAGDEPFLATTPPVAQDVSLFANIPARGAALERPPSSSSFLRVTPTPPRPSTADPETSLGRRRSKTAPAQPFYPPPPLPWTDKPLPLAIDFDHRRKRSVSSQVDTSDEKAAFGIALSRPKTTTGTESTNSYGVQRQRSGSTSGVAPPKKYSLTPTINATPTDSRRPSISLADSRRGSRARSNSTSSTNGLASRQRSNSQKSSTQTHPNVAPVLVSKISDHASSVLDDVEGTLSATITELQELQGPWDPPHMDDHAQTTDGARRIMVPEPPRSAPANQGYFMPRQATQALAYASCGGPDYSHSLPPTPLAVHTPGEESPTKDQLRSVQAAYEKLKRNMQAVSIENDTVKRQLSFARKRIEEADALRLERDKLDRALKDVQSNIDAALDRVRVSRNNEQAAQNKATALSARLDEANMQKVDVLENHLELQQRMGEMEREISALKKEIVTLKARPEQSALDEAEVNLRKSEERNKHLVEQVNSVDGRTDLPNVVADLAFKLEDMQKILAEKNSYIADLEGQSQAYHGNVNELNEHRMLLTEKVQAMESLSESHSRLTTDREASIYKMVDLERRISEQEQSSRTLRAERDQFRQLLYAEFRRVANEVHNRQHPATGLLDRKINLESAINEVRARAQRYVAKEKDRHAKEANSHPPQQRALELEQEVEYHIKDIVLYKLDVKGYKKDLKRAQAKIQQLTEQNAGLKQSPFSTREARPSISSQSSTSTVPQLTMVSTMSDAEPTTPRIVDFRGHALAVQTYTPSGSPRGSPAVSPMKEKKVFFPSPSS